VNPMWLIAGLLGMTGATLTWTIGFRLAAVSYAGSVPTTTLALLMGIGGFLMTDKRYRRWSWILVLLATLAGPFLRGASDYFLEGPIEFGALSLLLAGLAALTTRGRKPETREGTGGDSPD